jgi:hypothetical protein
MHIKYRRFIFEYGDILIIDGKPGKKAKNLLVRSDIAKEYDF